MLQGYLVNNGKQPQVVFPDTTVTSHKDGSKSFWFYDHGRPQLAVKNEKDVAYKVLSGHRR